MSPSRVTIMARASTMTAAEHERDNRRLAAQQLVGSSAGDVGQVVKGIRQSITKRGLSGAGGKTLRGVAEV